MGDIIDTTIWPRHRRIFYHVTGSAIIVEIRSQGNAAIGLTSKPAEDCEWVIGIGGNDNRGSWIGNGFSGNKVKKVATPRILSGLEYRSFWLSWYGQNVQFGRQGETAPIITHKVDKPLHRLKFITFSSQSERSEVRFRFQLSPVIEKPRNIATISGGTPRWEVGKDQLPNNAVIGGFENETLYIIRVFHNGSLTPGKFVPSEGVGYIAWGGTAEEKEDFDVLCGYDFLWVPTKGARIPNNAVEGGYSEDRHEILYIGRAYHKGHLIPGKVQPSHKVCYIPFDGREIAKETYEILIEPKENRIANKAFVNEVYLHHSDESDQEDDNQEDENQEGWENPEDIFVDDDLSDDNDLYEPPF